MLTKHLIPRSTADTPIEILIDVCRAIIREPRRYYQGDWIRKTQPNAPLILAASGGMFAGGNLVKTSAPACGTVCCVAGWVRVLKRGKGESMRDLVRSTSVCQEAANILERDAYLLRYGLFDGRRVPGRPGSKKYVENGIRHIETYLRSEFKYDGPPLLPMLKKELKAERAEAAK